MSIGRYICLFLTLGTAHASTVVTLRPDNTGTSNGDAFVTTGTAANDLSGNNYGAAGALAVSAALANGTFDSLIRFDTSSAKSTLDSTYGVGGWAIDSIALQLTTTTAMNPIFNPGQEGTFDVKWIPTDSWVEGSGNPMNPGTTGVKWTDFAGLSSGAEAEGAFTVANAGDGVTDTYTLTPSSSLMYEILSGSQVSLTMTADALDNAVALLFNSRNFGTSARRPGLIITASPISVPEPGRAMLLMMGAVCGLRRRCRPTTL